MIHYWHYRSGDLFAIQYRFEEAGDFLPTHQHERELLHNIIVLKGRCRFHSCGKNSDLSAGDVFDFDGSRPHRIEALEPCEILNFCLHGEPESYKTLSAEDRVGQI